MSLTPFMWIGESHRRSLLTSLCSGHSFFRTSPPIRNDFLFLFLHMHMQGDTILGWKATHAFLRPSRSPQYWLVGRQVKCHPAAASHAVEGEVVGPGTSARSRHHVLACRSGAPAAEQPRINGMALRPMGNLLWPILGALDYRD